VQDLLNLRWCIESAPLIHTKALDGLQVIDAKWCNEALQHDAAWLNTLMAQPHLLSDFMNEGSHLKRPLGKRFERYLEFWFRYSPRWRLLAANLQVQRLKQTEGEFDFIVLDQWAQQVIHFEVACKFYLGFKPSRLAEHWIGPSGHDRLDLKLDTLKRQVNLSQVPTAREQLFDIDIHIDARAALVKGFFFYHFSTLTRPVSPQHAAPNHNAGWWGYLNELHHLFNVGDATWVILPKSDWLANVHLNFSDDRLRSSRQMIQAVQTAHETTAKPVMLAQVEFEKGCWIETSRGCIVPNKWPGNFSTQ
jgi:hypothetical protein